MSLYTPLSLIRQSILEAENLTLSPSPAAQEVEDVSSTPDEIASRLTPAATPGMSSQQGASLTIPQISTPPTTINKTIINKDIVLSQLSELKSVITNYEKKFEGDDLTPEDANVYISSLLGTLVYHAEKFNDFISSGEEAVTEPVPTEEPESMPAEESEAINTPPSPEQPQLELGGVQ